MYKKRETLWLCAPCRTPALKCRNHMILFRVCLQYYFMALLSGIPFFGLESGKHEGRTIERICSCYLTRPTYNEEQAASFSSISAAHEDGLGSVHTRYDRQTEHSRTSGGRWQGWNGSGRLARNFIWQWWCLNSSTIRHVMLLDDVGHLGMEGESTVSSSNFGVLVCVWVNKRLVSKHHHHPQHHEAGQQQQEPSNYISLIRISR